MKSLSIGVRLTAWYSLILALSLCMFGGVSYFALGHSIRATIDAGLQQRLEGVRTIITENAPRGRAALEDELREFADGLGTKGRVRVADASGNIFASPGMESPREPKRSRRFTSTFYEDIDGVPFRLLRRTIEFSSARYDVTVATSTEDFAWALRRFRVVLFSAVPVFLVLAGFGGYWMSRRALAPVDEITRTARSIDAHDLSQRLKVSRTSDELERLTNTLNEMLARLESAFQRIRRFTADASHELRTPVSVIRTSAEISLRKPRSADGYRQALLQILREAEKVSQLIEQLLVLARADAGSAALPMIRTDVTKPLGSACQQANLLAEEKQLTFRASVPEQPIWVQGDDSLLERLFLILLDNAVKYTPSGGRIQVHLRSENGFAVADIRDTGIGIAADDLPHVFDRFYRADRARSRESGGTGLGLAIGRWIAEAHKGEIRAESDPSKGSLFQVRLPLSAE